VSNGGAAIETEELYLHILHILIILSVLVLAFTIIASDPGYFNQKIDLLVFLSLSIFISKA
jgi:hypothetical protein